MKRNLRLWLALKALRELGPAQMSLFALYQLGMRSGHYQRQLDSALTRLQQADITENLALQPCLPSLPDRETLLGLIGDQIQSLYLEADEIVDGKVRLFGGAPVKLELSWPGPLQDWTHYLTENNQLNGQDIKYVWEPARFGWACKLGMAYHLSKDERYAEAFWMYAERFFTSNPPYQGPHWSSAQEVAIRLIVLAFSFQVFSSSIHSTPGRLTSLARAITIHAERIPTTLVYARSQNNNHLILEALGLYTASAVLPRHPFSSRWHKLGWKWLLHAFQTQIVVNGTYSQHSTNYHRLMLQAALWALAVHDHTFPSEPVPGKVLDRLDAATRWLWKLLDPVSGQVPNLGHNDGAYILPLSVCPYSDFRPVIAAAARAFLHADLLPQGAWIDMACWLASWQKSALTEIGLDQYRTNPTSNGLGTGVPHILLNQKSESWAYFHITHFHSRPAHADQLHIDLWWRGLNIAMDPGTYLYNAPPPWDNALISASVHNTVVVDHTDFMTRSGRFLYLDWAQSQVISSPLNPDTTIDRGLVAVHNGYRKLGIRHNRTLAALDDGGWIVTDKLDGPQGRDHTARLHWLLPDWEYEIHELAGVNGVPSYKIRIHSPHGWVELKLATINPQDRSPKPARIQFQLIRAGELQHGKGDVSPIAGWTSPTYGDKIACLACVLEVTQTLPIQLKSEWTFPVES